MYTTVPNHVTACISTSSCVRSGSIFEFFYSYYSGILTEFWRLPYQITVQIKIKSYILIDFHDFLGMATSYQHKIGDDIRFPASPFPPARVKILIRDITPRQNRK